MKKFSGSGNLLFGLPAAALILGLAGCGEEEIELLWNGNLPRVLDEAQRSAAAGGA